MTVNNTVDRYGVMGNPVAHSRSPLIHAEFSRQTGQSIDYQAILVELTRFPEAVRRFGTEGGKGLNVTLPFKEQAFNLVDERSTRADAAGAVNTICFSDRLGLYGDNTDGVGFVRDFLDNHGGAIHDRHILILGAGGAIRGILPAIIEQAPASIWIANRTHDRAAALASTVTTCEARACHYGELADRGFDVVINGTPLSLSGKMVPVSAAIVGSATWCYDLAYGSEPTAFVRWGQAHGAAVALDGLGMLVEQAAEAFLLWRGVRPDTAPVIEKLRRR